MLDHSRTLSRRDAPAPRHRVGLVLGAGGATGAAFHAGTLHALRHDIGWDPDSADVIVGTSAGSIVGGLLRAGLTTDDLAAWGSSAEALPAGRERRAVLDRLRASRHRVVPSIPRLPSPSLLRAVVRPSSRALHTVALAMLPSGWIDTDLQRIGALIEEWPDRDLWIASVRISGARRVVFGRDDHSVGPGQAIAASCAIPGLFTPVRIGTHRYIDGGAHSPSNADLLVDADIDTAIVLSPMTADRGASGRRLDRRLRALIGRRLRAECDALSSVGIDVHVFEPDATTLSAMGINALAERRAPDVVRESFFAAGARIAADHRLRSLLTDRTPDTAQA